MNNERELLRRSAGLKPINEGNTSKLRTLDYEADLLRSFSTFLSSLKSLKERINGRPYGYGPGPYGAMRDEGERPDCERLRMIAKSKLELVEETIDEIFKSKREKEYEGDREERDED